MSFIPTLSSDEICVGTDTSKCLTDELIRIENSIPDAVSGPQGPAGENGADGEDGADGITPHIGTNGNWYIGDADTGVAAQGPQGAQGIQGEAGATGAQGPKGDKGDKGDTGAQGPKGDKGNKGDTGATGPQGPAGADGDDFNGNLTGGILRLQGNQAAFFSGSQEIFGSNNWPTRIAGNAITATKSITVDSDERVKDIFDVDMEALKSFVARINLVGYSYKEFLDEKHIGVVAQQLISINPEIAEYFVRETVDGYYAVDYTALTFAMAYCALQK